MDHAKNLRSTLISQLHDLRQQGMKMAEINPIAALADVIAKQLSTQEITTDDLQKILNEIGQDTWQEMSHRLATQTDLHKPSPLQDLARLIDGKDIGRLHYRAVFTAHPVFALTPHASQALCEAATQIEPLPMPDAAFATRTSVTLGEEHAEAMAALTRARGAISDLNEQILTYLEQTKPESWRDTLPQMMGVSTWVGYDLDGRTDITWSQSIVLRLSEKITALKR